MTWKGEKQRHMMAAKGIKTTVKDFTNRYTSMKYEMETKLQSEIADMFRKRGININPTDIDVYYDPVDEEVTIEIFDSDETKLWDFTLESQKRLPSFVEWLEMEHEDEFQDTYMTAFLDSVQQHFNDIVPEVKREATYETIEENYGSLEEWLMRTNIKKYNAIEEGTLYGVGEAYKYQYEDEYRDDIHDMVNKSAQRLLGPKVVIGGFRVDNYKYSPFNIQINNADMAEIDIYINKISKYLTSGGTRT